MKATLFVHISVERKEWISCNDVSCTMETYVSMYVIHSGMDYAILIVQELCESRGGRPGLSVLTSVLVSVDVKLY